jgi:hypothetical protein
MPGQSHIDRTQIQMTISSAPSGLVAFIVTPTQAKAWAKFPWPFGPKAAPQSDRLLRCRFAEPWVSKGSKGSTILASKFQIQDSAS